MTAELRYPAGHVGRITASLWSSSLLRMSARVWGDAGRLVLLNPLSPQVWHRLTVVVDGLPAGGALPSASHLRLPAGGLSRRRLRRDADAHPPADSVANMRVIDAVYRAAGLRPQARLDFSLMICAVVFPAADTARPVHRPARPPIRVCAGT